jgi:two-component system response regulator HydG
VPLLRSPDQEKERIMEALERAHGNKTQAARLLQIDRKTLYNKMHLYGIK